MRKFYYKPSNKGLLKFRYNHYSQNVEDGIIVELIKRLNLNELEVCEFGAWDGIHLSNTFNLIKNHNARAVLIEGDDKKFPILSTAIANIRFPSMGTIAERQQMVTISTEFSLSKLKKFGKSVI